LEIGNGGCSGYPTGRRVLTDGADALIALDCAPDLDHQVPESRVPVQALWAFLAWNARRRACRDGHQRPERRETADRPVRSRGPAPARPFVQRRWHY
jgi:hypothetical protein